MSEVSVLDFDAARRSPVIFVSEVEAAHLRLVSAFNGSVKHIDGRTMSGPTPAFRAISTALQFPSYFGYNWDALDECLGDVRSWLHEDAILVLVEHADSLVATEHLPMLVDVLCSGSERAGALYDEDGIALERRPTALQFVFFVDSGLLKETAIRLGMSGRSLAPDGTYLAIS